MTSNTARPHNPNPVGQTWRAAHLLCSVRAPSTVAPTETLQSHTESGGAHKTGSVSSIEEDVHASIITDQSEDIHTDTKHHLHLYGIYKMRNAYYPRTLNIALTLKPGLHCPDCGARWSPMAKSAGFVSTSTNSEGTSVNNVILPGNILRHRQ